MNFNKRNEINNSKFPKYSILKAQHKSQLSTFSFIMAIIFWTSVYSTYVSGIIHGYKGWSFIIFVWFIGFLLSKPSARRSALHALMQHRKEILMLLLWIFAIIITWGYDRGDLNTIYSYFAPATVYFVVYVLAIMYFHENPNRYIVFIKSIMIVLVIISLMTIPTLFKYPFIVRDVKTDPEMLSVYGLSWVGAISYFSGVAVSLPFLFAMVFEARKHTRIIYLFCIGAIILSLILSTMSASVYLTIIGFIGISLLAVRYNYRKNKLFVFLLFTTLLLMIYLMSYYNINHLEFLLEKTRLFTITASEEGISQVERGSDAVLSIRSFISSPFIGVGPKARGSYTEIGEHSTWLDGLAEFGIVGFAPFIGFLYFGFRRVYRAFKAEPNNHFQQARIVVCFVYFIHGLTNPWGFDGYCAVFFAALVMSPK